MMRWVFLAVAFFLLVPVTAQQDASSDREAVRQAVLDYVEGIYNVEPQRIEHVRRCLIPDEARSYANASSFGAWPLATNWQSALANWQLAITSF